MRRTGRDRVPPGPGQESVWDYPRPPALVPDTRLVRVELGGVVIAETTAALRVLETSHPPTFYLPLAALRDVEVEATGRTSFCEWKGRAHYLTLRAGGRTEADVAWTYPDPVADYAAIAEHVALYPGRMDACWVGEARVEPQPGGFYGGWITPDVVGPFKGAPGTLGW
jgi:uncharacterized protein (DUF427 family)